MKSVNLSNLDSPVVKMDYLDDLSINDIFTAYGLSPEGLTEEERTMYIKMITDKRTFPYLYEVLISDRKPKTIIKLAYGIGMSIPINHRSGIKSYTFYVKNIRYYESLFDRANQKMPKLYEIYLSSDPLTLLMKFRDDEIQKPEFILKKNYDTRLEMLNDFIKQNIDSHGRFELLSNSKSCYSTKQKTIKWTMDQYELSWVAADFIKLINVEQGKVWMDTTRKNWFSSLTLHHLRKIILEKINQWNTKDLGTYSYNIFPQELVSILQSLEIILESDLRNSVTAYIGEPTIPVTF